MKRIVLLFIVISLGFYGYQKYTRQEHAQRPGKSGSLSVDSRKTSTANPPAASRYACDGRTHCSQMTSCEEARFFIRNCPGTKMDGDNDGIPCERQWCR